MHYLERMVDELISKQRWNKFIFKFAKLNENAKKIIEQHGLKDEEFENAENYLKEPNLLELRIFSAMWNEHCSYKSSKSHLKTLTC